MTAPIVVRRLNVEVDGAGARATKDDAASIVFTGIRVVVLGFVVGASRNVAVAIARARGKTIATAHTTFVQNVAFTIAFAFRDACSTTHPALVEHQTTAVVHAGRCIVVARKDVSAANFACSTAFSAWVKNVARTIALSFWDAVTTAHPTFVNVIARAVVNGRVFVEVASRRIGATSTFREVARPVVEGSFRVEVACQRIGATGTRFNLACSVVDGRCWIVVACLRLCATVNDARVIQRVCGR